MSECVYAVLPILQPVSGARFSGIGFSVGLAFRKSFVENGVLLPFPSTSIGDVPEISPSAR